MDEMLPGLESERRSVELSQWFTPSRTADRIAEFALRFYRDPRLELRALEPSCGHGALLRALEDEARCTLDLHAIDIDQSNVDFCDEAASRIVCCDFLKMRPVTGNLEFDYDLVVMNPPFEGGAAEAHVMHALQWSPRVVAHVPLTTLEGKERRAGLWSKCRLNRLAICSTRPKYGERGGATAMCTIEVSPCDRDPGKSSEVQVEWWP